MVSTPGELLAMLMASRRLTNGGRFGLRGLGLSSPILAVVGWNNLSAVMLTVMVDRAIRSFRTSSAGRYRATPVGMARGTREPNRLRTQERSGMAHLREDNL